MKDLIVTVIRFFEVGWPSRRSHDKTTGEPS